MRPLPYCRIEFISSTRMVHATQRRGLGLCTAQHLADSALPSPHFATTRRHSDTSLISQTVST